MLVLLVIGALVSLNFLTWFNFCRYEANSFKHNNYDQYVKSDRLENIDGTKLNMYVAVEPTKATHKSFEHEVIL